MKAEIEKILSKWISYDPIEHVDVNDEENNNRTTEMINEATSSITALIIKWLESKKQNMDYAGSGGDKWMWEELQKEARNQLLTELIGEVK
jgi:glutamate formiminotransferase